MIWSRDIPLKTLGHSRTDAHSIQCSGNRGVFAIVHIGYAVAGVIKDIYPVSLSSSEGGNGD